MFSRFWQPAKPYRRDFVVGLVYLVLTNALALTIPWLLREAIHAMERGSSPRALVRFALAMAALAVAQSWVRTLSRLRILGASRRIVYDLRNSFFAHLERLDARYYDTHPTGDIMSRGVNDLQLLQAFYGPGVMNALNTVVVFAAVLVLLFRIDASLTLVAMLLLPALYFAVNGLSKRLYARSLLVQEQLALISNRVQENLGGIQQVKIYAQEAREIEGFRELCAEYRRRNLRLAWTRGAMVSVIGMASGFGTVVVLALGGQHVIAGKIGFGDFVAYNAYLALLAWPTIALGWIVNVFQRAAGAMARLQEVTAHEPAIPPPDGDATGEFASVDGDIEIRDLTYSYAAGGAPGGAPALDGVSLTIPRGSRLALVGPVGSGKSTLVALLARVYPAPAGSIFVGGRDLTTIPVRHLRRSLGYVPQEAFLFSKTIRENILLGRPDATDAELDAAVRLSHLAGDLALFPQGLDTMVGERGITLSGGQRQRASLARAAVGSPRILILDDSLSSVDADTEAKILDELRGRLGDRTCIFITHRLTTLASMDRIVVLDGGRVVEQGTHAELMARAGVYARLFEKQALEARLEAE